MIKEKSEQVLQSLLGGHEIHFPGLLHPIVLVQGINNSTQLKHVIKNKKSTKLIDFDISLSDFISYCNRLSDKEVWRNVTFPMVMSKNES